MICQFDFWKFKNLKYQIHVHRQLELNKFDIHIYYMICFETSQVHLNKLQQILEMICDPCHQ